MAGSIHGGDDEPITAINVTPLVDIVLVLLIIMMVTATAIVSKTLPMELPEAATGESTPKTFSVSIGQDGTLALDAEPVTRAVLQTRVREARQKDADVRAVIAADGRVPHASVVQIIDLLRQEQVTKFAINVKPSDLK